MQNLGSESFNGYLNIDTCLIVAQMMCLDIDTCIYNSSSSIDMYVTRKI
jgi:hypothetical protein